MAGQVSLSPAEGHHGHVDLTKDILYPGFLWVLLSDTGSGPGSGPDSCGPGPCSGVFGSGPGSCGPVSGPRSSDPVSSGPRFGPSSPGTGSGPWSWSSDEECSVGWTSLVWAGGPGGLCGWWRDREGLRTE